MVEQNNMQSLCDQKLSSAAAGHARIRKCDSEINTAIPCYDHDNAIMSEFDDENASIDMLAS